MGESEDFLELIGQLGDIPGNLDGVVEAKKLLRQKYMLGHNALYQKWNNLLLYVFHGGKRINELFTLSPPDTHI